MDKIPMIVKNNDGTIRYVHKDGKFAGILPDEPGTYRPHCRSKHKICLFSGCVRPMYSGDKYICKVSNRYG